MKAIEKFWMFGVRPHQDDALLQGLKNPLQRHGSRITPAEGAFMLGIPNMIMVCADGSPAPGSDEARQYCESFTAMKRVLWSATGSNGFRTGTEERFICSLAEKYPNIAGAFLDDFVYALDKPEEIAAAEKTLKEIRSTLDQAARYLQIASVCYAAFIPEKYHPLFDNIDILTLWTWDSNELPLLPERFAKLEKIFPKQKKMLGIYLYDFLNQKAVPDEFMKLQCDFAWSTLREKRIDGIIIEANSVMAIGLPSEAYVRKWIADLRETELD